MSDSHVLDIRRKTAEERLRSDHIDMMYHLEEAIKLNEQYEKEIDLLKQQLEEAVKPEKEIVIKEDGDIIQGHVKTIEVLQNTITDMTNVMKTLKTKEALNQKAHQSEIELLKEEIRKMEDEWRESETRYKSLIDELQSHSHIANDDPPVRQEPIDDKDNTINILDKKCTDLEMQVQASKDIISRNEKMMNEKDEAYREEAEKRNEIYIKQKSVILELESEKSQLRSQLAGVEEYIQDLESRLLSEEGKSAAILATLSTSRDENCEVDVVDSSAQTDEIPEDKVEKDTTTANQFKEYIQLKKENMTLKLQLAHKESGKKNARIPRKSDTFASISSNQTNGKFSISSSNSVTSAARKK